MSTVDQYRVILHQVLESVVNEMTARIVDSDLSLEAYRSCTGYIAGVRRAQIAAQEAHDKLYGREPTKDTYENPYG